MERGGRGEETERQWTETAILSSLLSVKAANRWREEELLFLTEMSVCISAQHNDDVTDWFLPLREAAERLPVRRRWQTWLLNCGSSVMERTKRILSASERGRAAFPTTDERNIECEKADVPLSGRQRRWGGRCWWRRRGPGPAGRRWCGSVGKMATGGFNWWIRQRNGENKHKSCHAGLPLEVADLLGETHQQIQLSNNYKTRFIHFLIMRRVKMGVGRSCWWEYQSKV